MDYLDRLQWDGVPRLDSWLINYCGANKTDLNKAIGRKMLVAAVRRVRSPGCKFDYIVVLESESKASENRLPVSAGDAVQPHRPEAAGCRYTREYSRRVDL